MLINEEMILMDVDISSKDEAIKMGVELFRKAGKLNDVTAYYEAVLERESAMATNMGDGIAIPHGRTDGVKEAGLSFMHLRQPIAWGDEQPVQMIFQIGVPEKAGNMHLRILSLLARKLIYPEFRERLFQAKEKEEILAIIREATGGLEE